MLHLGDIDYHIYSGCLEIVTSKEGLPSMRVCISADSVLRGAFQEGNSKAANPPRKLDIFPGLSAKNFAVSKEVLFLFDIPSCLLNTRPFSAGLTVKLCIIFNFYLLEY